MALFGRRKPTVGLDIGSSLIKAVVIDHSKGAPELVKVGIAALSPDAIVEGEVMDPGIVADAIRECMAMAGIKTKEVVTAVGGRDVIVKKIQAERVPEREAREVMRWEAQQHVPFEDMDAVELDFQILNPDDEFGHQMDVLLVAAKRDLVEARLRLLGEAGLSPSIVDVDAFALHNAFELNYPASMRGVVALVNIGHEVTNINVLDDGIPVLTRDIAFGTRRLREDMQRERGLTSEDASALITGYDRSPHVDAVLDARVEEVAVAVERAVAFLLSTSKAGTVLSSVYTCGGGARTPGLNEALGRRLRVPVEQANPLSSLNILPGALDTLVVDEVAPLLMLPVGLALRQS